MDGDIARWDEHWRKCKGGNKCLVNDETHRKYFRWLLEDFGGVPETSLELGCGRGTLSQLLLLRGTNHATLGDTSKEALEIATKNFENAHIVRTRYTLFEGDCDSLVWLPFRYSLVFSVGLLEHFADPLRALRVSEILATAFSWHVVIEKTASNQGFYRNDLPREAYAVDGWQVKDTDVANIFIVSKRCEPSSLSS